MPTVLLLLTLADPTVGAWLLAPAARWPALSATVRVSGGEEAPVASAVCVGCRDGLAYLLTAAHAIPPGKARVFEFFSQAGYPRADRSVIGCEELVRLASADVALVRVAVGDAAVATAVLAGPGQRPRRFPLDAVSAGCPDGSPPVFRRESVTGKKLVRMKGGGVAFFWETPQAPTGGMSGGPLLDATGRVIGLCTAAQEGRGYFVHLDEILAGLKPAGHDWLFERSGKSP